jgi:hypothetical protein
MIYIKNINYQENYNVKLSNEVKDIVYKTIDWCQKELGLSKYQIDTLSVYFDTDIEEYAKAEFDFGDTEITLYIKNIFSKRDLVVNTIHEYIHYLQPRNWYTRFFNKLETMNSELIGYNEYYTHPYEFEAKYLSEYEANRCMIEIGLKNLAKLKIKKKALDS